MQEIEAYIESQQQLDVRTCREETREALDVLPCGVRSLYRMARGPHDDVANAGDFVEQALLMAYRHSIRFKGSAQMSTWLTAVALLMLGPGLREALAPEDLSELTGVSQAVASKREQEE